eukprot:CAMPEP_0174312692 /NCGR_PEP_ID=MMETSP0810-20121108/4447_1 /TAXON_ID=73025 ORGANISM="Eutreptiella gymnastica-like, Strain CCMP1594" /NCGR_SAMPLE_ID=MMETSP0810 /ASSEMBLY_ACC=CAM_ASM_000659 /LENGTH=77 /DNA_ID=CAMNT_0015421145 /DNA_START=350 /DNA_END=580 /DNA_ORIENTATION=-
MKNEISGIWSAKGHWQVDCLASFKGFMTVTPSLLPITDDEYDCSTHPQTPRGKGYRERDTDPLVRGGRGYLGGGMGG